MFCYFCAKRKNNKTTYHPSHNSNRWPDIEFHTLRYNNIMQQKTSSKFWLRFLFTVLTIFFIPALFGILNKTGCFILFWQNDDLSAIQYESGYAYYARIPNENAVKLDLPIYLIEDNVLIDTPVLAVNQDLVKDIKEIGKGLYQLLPNNNIIFSSIDHSDPASGVHAYSVLSPVVIRMRYLLPVLAIVLLLMMTAGLMGLAAKIRKDVVSLQCFKSCVKNFAGFISILILLMLVLPWKSFFVPPVFPLTKSFWIMPLIQRNAVMFLLLGFSVLYLYYSKRKSKWIALLMGLILVINLAYYFIPERDYYGVRTDSAEYIQSYHAGSIRTPGYPRFVEDVMTLFSGSDLDYWRSEEGLKDLARREELLFKDHSGDSRGLVQIVRAQKAVLGLCFLIATVLLCFLIPPHFVFLFGEFVLANQFLGVYNNYVMSEVISQAALLLSCGIFCFLVGKRMKWSFPFLGFFCGISIIIRPSNMFILGLLLLAAILLFVQDRKKALLPILAGIGICGFFILIPAVNIFRQYHQVIFMPNQGYAAIGQTLAVMDETDLSLPKDEVAREFLTASFQQIQAMKSEGKALTQNDYVFHIALEQAKKLGFDPVTANVLFDRVSRDLVSVHKTELLAAYRDQLQLGLERTRLSLPRLPYSYLLAVFIVISLFRCSRYSLTGFVLISLHNLHLMISIMNQPERRYIWSTEIFFLMGAALIVYNVFRSEQHQTHRVRHNSQ